ncbi:hypothetical protein SAMN04488122_1939 [Chitinophaga arvensicola]|uniref:Uncharacterized protein n=2 Tax=Chitinophaga arvensicola TaxID=29529 RepID=A0A1I0QZQ2_9BACT|nr:hypothetical protein SAMN04488122_1939 [Chitinophaga arvensicola]
MLIGGAGFIASQANAQLKVGKNPTTIEKSAILDLDADKQGLLLPRLLDTLDINGLTPPNGMVIFLKKAGAEGFYVRNHGYWEKMANSSDVASTWSMKGNAATSADFIGTTNSIPFSIRANNVEGIVVKDGYTFLKKLDLTTGVDVVMVDKTDGKISYRTISESAFSNAINELNGLTATKQKLTTGAAATAGGNANDYKFSTSGTDTHVLTIATQDGTGTVGYGLLSSADFNKFKKAVDLQINTFATASNAKGLSYDNTGTNALLTLHPADATNPGAVSTVAQEFNGLKTFLNTITGNEDLSITKKGTFGTGVIVTTGGATITGDSRVTGKFDVAGAGGNLTVAGTTGLAGTLDVTGATKLANTLDVAEKATLAKDLQVKGNTLLDNNLTLTNIADGAATDNVVLLRQGTTGTVVKRALSSSAFTDLTFATDHAGLDLAVAKDASNKVTISIPIAAPTTPGGLMSNDKQSFAGAKKFGNEVSIQKNVSIGDTTNAATSTLQVAGSLAMTITTLSTAGSYTVKETDNTILVSVNGACTVVLPAATTCTGRIYTVKKIPAAGATDDTNIDNDVKITSAGGTVEGGTQLAIYNDWTFYTIQSNGTNWYVIKK